jgi:hypothetical protein
LADTAARCNAGVTVHEGEAAMHATIGDQIVVEAAIVDRRRRYGEVMEVLGTSDAEHYRVRWQDGHESIFYPGPDARVQHQPQ